MSAGTSDHHQDSNSLPHTSSPCSTFGRCAIVVPDNVLLRAAQADGTAETP